MNTGKPILRTIDTRQTELARSSAVWVDYSDHHLGVAVLHINILHQGEGSLSFASTNAITDDWCFALSF